MFTVYGSYSIAVIGNLVICYWKSRNICKRCITVLTQLANSSMFLQTQYLACRFEIVHIVLSCKLFILVNTFNPKFINQKNNMKMLHNAFIYRRQQKTLTLILIYKHLKRNFFIFQLLFVRSHLERSFGLLHHALAPGPPPYIECSQTLNIS